MGERTYACKRCWDNRWVLARAETNEAMPCPSCNADQWQRWQAGEFAPRLHKAAGFEEPADLATVGKALIEARAKLDRA